MNVSDELTNADGTGSQVADGHEAADGMDEMDEGAVGRVDVGDSADGQEAAAGMDETDEGEVGRVDIGDLADTS